MASFASTALLSVLLATSLAFFSTTTEADEYDYPPIVSGLSFDFYKSSCPKLESIVKDFLEKSFKNDTGLAAGLLRLHFHDCFVQGCDGSILLDGSASGPSEQSAIPNLSLQPAAFKAINDLRDAIDEACGVVVSCADVVALAARDSVYMSGGPNYKVPLGRRDGVTFATSSQVLADLPSPFSNVTTLLNVLNNINLDADDLVALSGGHTIGKAHCGSFTNRLYPQQDALMNQWFASQLKLTCPASNSTNTTFNDIRTPFAFDNKYYVDLLNREGLFTSDQDLYSDKRTKAIVMSYALNQTVFFEQFVYSIVKMGQLSLLTGTQGEIRTNCSAINSGSSSSSRIWSVVDSAIEGVVKTESLMF